MADRPQISVVPGPQAWRLIRTDRDGASAGEIPQMAAAAVRWFLLRNRAGRGAKHELVATGPNEWRFADARPMRVLSVSKSPQPSPAGQVLADRHRSVPNTVPTVTGSQPWFVDVEFWWRGPEMTIDYPGLSEGIFGRDWELNGADWVLDTATQIPEAANPPSDATWGDVMGDRAEDALKEAGANVSNVVKGTVVPVLGVALGVAAIYYLLSRRRG